LHSFYKLVPHQLFLPFALRLSPFAQKLRANGTKSVRTLWSNLNRNDGPLASRALGGEDRQVRFERLGGA